MDKVLLVRTDRIGDVILSLPVARLLKIKGFEVYYLVNPYTSSLLSGHPWLNGFYEIEVKGENRGDIRNFRKTLKVFKKIREKGIQTALMLYSKPILSILLKLTGFKLIGFSDKPYTIIFDWKVKKPKKPLHEAEKNLLLVKALGIEPEFYPPKLFPEEREIKRAKAFWPEGAFIRGILNIEGFTAKTWPVEVFVELAWILKKSGIEVAFTGVKRSESIKVGLNLTGKLSLREFMALLKTSQFIVTGATGAMHMAAALDIPVFAIFDPNLKNHIVRWRPLGKIVKIYRPVKNLLEITPQRVAMDIKELFKEIL